MSASANGKQEPSAAHDEVEIIKEDVITTSDNDATEPERPVRRKLQETRITSDAGTPATDENTKEDDRGRLKKRSHDDLQAEEEKKDPQADGGHRRKRSRDASNDGEHSKKNNTERPATPEPIVKDSASSHILSPKKKRSLDQLQENGATTQSEEKAQHPEGDKERETKRHRDASKERRDTANNEAAPVKSSLPKSFMNTSAVSPFASLGGSNTSESKDTKLQPASSSAFGASKLASFAGSEQSPFSALSSSTPTLSSFAKPVTTTEKTSASGTDSVSSNKSPFSNTGASGFAALGSSGFGSGFGSGGTKLSSFASATGPGFAGATEAKPFGAERNSDDEEEEDEGNVITAGFEKEKEDERFYAQQIETGEENEKTYFSCKAKLFHFSNKEWKERGVGTFKINVKEPLSDTEDGSTKKTARMIMRADGVLRVMLNSPIFKGMPVGEVSGAEPKGKQLNLASVEEGKTVPLLLRVGNADSAKELYHVITDLQKEL